MTDLEYEGINILLILKEEESSSHSRSQTIPKRNVAGVWLTPVTQEFIEELIKLKTSKPFNRWIDEDWEAIGLRIGMSAEQCKTKKGRLYKQHAAFIRKGKPCGWTHLRRVHVLKYGAEDKGPKLPLILETINEEALCDEDDDENDAPTGTLIHSVNFLTVRSLLYVSIP